MAINPIPPPPSGFTRKQTIPEPPPGFTRKQNDLQPSDHFFARFGRDLQQRFGQQGAEIIARRVADEQGFASTALQLTGKVGAGTVLDFLGEALISGGRGLKAITPDALEDAAVQTATKAGVFLLDTELGQKGLEAAKKGLIEWEEFAKENPIMARNIEAVTNIGLLVTPVRGKKTPKTAQKLRKAAGKRGAQQRREFIDDLVLPVQTEAIRTRQARQLRVSEGTGLNAKQKVKLSPQELDSAKAISGIRGISKKQSFTGNLNLMLNWVNRESARVVGILERHGRAGRYSPVDLDANLSSVLIRARANPALSAASTEEAARRVIAYAKKAAGENPRTLAGLLKTRKQIDRWAERNKPNIFQDGVAHTAITTAVRETRKEINNFIIRRSPHGRLIEKSLKKQSAVLRAADDVAVKAGKEADSRIARAFERAVKLIPIRNETVAAMSLLFGVGGLGAASLFLPFVQKMLLTVGLYLGARRVITSPKTRAGLAKLVEVFDKGIGTGARGGIALTTDPEVLDLLREDRDYLKQLLRETEAEDD